MYRAKPFLDRKSLLALYYSYIQSYLSYAKKNKKNVIRIVHNKIKFEHTKKTF